MSNPTIAMTALTSRLRSAAAPRAATVVFCPPGPARPLTLLRLLAWIAVTGALSALAAPALFPGVH